MTYITNQSSTQERRVLLCVCDTSPDAIIQTLRQFLTARECFTPHEIHVITNSEGEGKIFKELLMPQPDSNINAVQRVMRKHAPVTPALPSDVLRFDLSTVHVTVQSGGIANTVFRVLHDIKNIPNNQLYASVTGGCSGMAFYLGHIFSLLATGKDKLWHLVTDSQLEELTVVRLGKNFQSQLPTKALKDFDLCIRLMEASQNPPRLEMKYSQKRTKGYLLLCEELVELSPLESIVFAICVLARANEKEHGASVDFGSFKDKELKALNEVFGVENLLRGQAFNVNPKIQEKLREKVGIVIAKHFILEADPNQKKEKGDYRPVQLKAPASCLVTDNLSSLWRVLKPALERMNNEIAQ